MKAVIICTVLFALLVLATAKKHHVSRTGEADADVLFRQFVTKYKKVYASPSEHSRRFAIFKDNLDRIAHLRKQDPEAIFDVTRFADMSPQEFRDTMLIRDGLGRHRALNRLQPIDVLDYSGVEYNLPKSFDWRNKSAVTHVYDQGQCGSCWAFSVVENIESVWYLAGHPMTKLSVQQIVDCDTKDQGCNGGDPPLAYEYVIKAGGLESAADYGYHADDGKCKFDHTKVTAKISSWTYATKDKNETEMAIALVNKSPLSICVEADTWQFYGGGIITHNCGTDLDHCVQLVGFDTNAKGIDYWIIRNSWGADWGEDGYIYVQRNKDLCGVADEATTAIV